MLAVPGLGYPHPPPSGGGPAPGPDPPKGSAAPPHRLRHRRSAVKAPPCPSPSSTSSSTSSRHFLSLLSSSLLSSRLPALRPCCLHCTRLDRSGGRRFQHGTRGEAARGFLALG